MIPKVSIVILAWNNQKDLQACIESICDTYKDYYQIIVVDNASTDNTAEYLQELEQIWDNKQGILTIITNKDNLGYAAGNNVALRYIQGEYILWLNQDIVVQPNSIEKLVSILDTHDNYAMVAPQLQYPDGSIQKSCRRIPNPRHMLSSVIKGAWDDTFDYTQSQECEQPMASAIMMRSNIMSEMGGFDDNRDYWLFFNDVDLSKNLQSRGYITYYIADSHMYHYHGASTKKLINIKKRLYWQRGFNRYFSKWHYSKWYQRVVLYVLSWALFGGLIIRDIIRGK